METPLICPKCGSKAIYDIETVPPVHVCDDCDHEWEDE